MMAKISSRGGSSFGGCVGYVMGKKEAKLLDGEGVFLENRQTIAESFEMQSLLNPRLGRKVGHISLNFPAQDAGRISDDFMRQVAGEYMRKMGIVNTQFIVVRHDDRDHPHCHIVYNRVDNDGRTISDRNERLRSTKICREITERHGLYIAGGKENVNRQSLRDPDSVKYAIYDAVKAALPHCKSWVDLERRLEREGIAVTFKYKGGTGQREGIIFGKDGFSLPDKKMSGTFIRASAKLEHGSALLSACRKFNGSKIDRAFSFSKLDAALNANAQRQESRTAPTIAPSFPQSLAPSFGSSPSPERSHHSAPSHGHSHSAGVLLGLGGLFDIQPEAGEEDFVPAPKKKKKKKRGRSM